MTQTISVSAMGIPRQQGHTHPSEPFLSPRNLQQPSWSPSPRGASLFFTCHNSLLPHRQDRAAPWSHMHRPWAPQGGPHLRALFYLSHNTQAPVRDPENGRGTGTGSGSRSPGDWVWVPFSSPRLLGTHSTFLFFFFCDGEPGSLVEAFLAFFFFSFFSLSFFSKGRK